MSPDRARGAASRIAEAKAAITVDPAGTRLLVLRARLPIVQSSSVMRGKPGASGSNRIASLHMTRQQRIVAGAGRRLGATQRIGPAQQLLHRLGHDHRRLGRPADDEAHQRGADLGIAKAGLARLLQLQAATEHIVGARLIAPLLDLLLDMRAERRARCR